LIFGGVGLKDVDELVLSICHNTPCGLATINTEFTEHTEETTILISVISVVSVFSRPARRPAGRKVASRALPGTLFSCRRIAAVVRVHHRRDPVSDERLRRIGRPRRRALDLGKFIRIEPRQHVIGEIALWIPAPDADAEPRELF